MQSRQFAFQWKRMLLMAACVSMLHFPRSICIGAPAVTQVSAGGNNFCLFVKPDGSLWGMGDNSYGQLGLGAGVLQTNLPQQILSSNVYSIAAGGQHSVVLDSNANVWAMGYNFYGELGDGTTNNHYFPEQVVSGSVAAIGAGGFHSLFTTAVFVEPHFTFKLWGMGDNELGQLGLGVSPVSSSSPVQIQSTELLSGEVEAIACGKFHSLIIEGGVGSLWTTGNDTEGQTGIGSFGGIPIFQEIVSNNVTAIAAGYFHSLFIKSGGSLWVMGDDSRGELGDNATANQDTPQQVGVNVTAIAGGYDFSLFIKSDGSLWGMGANDLGQLGDGTTTDRHVPVLIVASNVVAIAAGQYASYFIKSDGSLWAMGDNSAGELGDGTRFRRYFPEQIVPLVIPQPAITSASLSNTSLVLSGTNGQSGRYYFTLASTNLALPLRQWTPIATNLVTKDGAFTLTVTNAVSPDAGQAFYILQAQAATP